VLGQELRDSDANAVRSQTSADYVVTSQNGWSTYPVGAAEAVAAVPGVKIASAVRWERGRVGEANVDVSGIDPATIASVYSFHWSADSNASLASLGAAGAIVRESVAEKHGLTLGEHFRLVTPAGESIALRVAGIYDPPRFDSLLGHVVVSKQAFDATFPRPSAMVALVRAPGAPKAALERAVTAYPEAKVLTRNEFVESRVSDLASLLNMLYVLLALSVVVSLFGLVNTLSLAVFERTRELGMLRTVGMTRRQARRMVRHESVIIALIGAALGIPLGVFLAALVTRSLAEYDLSFSLPGVTIVAFVAVAIASGVNAAHLPARSASKLNVLRALQYA